MPNHNWNYQVHWCFIQIFQDIYQTSEGIFRIIYVVVLVCNIPHAVWKHSACEANWNNIFSPFNSVFVCRSSSLSVSQSVGACAAAARCRIYLRAVLLRSPDGHPPCRHTAHPHPSKMTIHLTQARVMRRKGERKRVRNRDWKRRERTVYPCIMMWGLAIQHFHASTFSQWCRRVI